MTEKSALSNAISWLSWPVLFVVCMVVTGYGFEVGRPILFFNLVYLFLAVSLFALERTMPHEPVWNENDGQTFANIAHTLLSKGCVQTLVVFSTVIGLAAYITPVSEPGVGFWPREWPVWAQVALGVVVAEFGLYWAHRLAHEWLPLWHFHAIHHSVTRLWIINTGRFHFVDSLVSILLGVVVLLAFGAPREVVTWLSAITAFLGMLTHCNVDMRFGPISWVFNTPGLHRWHHSREVREGNKNYGENLMIWDQIFGTFYNPPRRPPADIGIDEYMPADFLGQLAHPFRRMQP